MTESYDLSLRDCEELLNCGDTGRVALSAPTGPYIVPVNYSVVDKAIILRTSPYSVLGTYGRDTTLAFEIDHVDHDKHRGWSVVARGRSDMVTDPSDLDQIVGVWPARPWVSGNRTLVLRLRWNEISGRRIGDGWEPLQTLALRRSRRE